MLVDAGVPSTVTRTDGAVTAGITEPVKKISASFFAIISICKKTVEEPIVTICSRPAAGGAAQVVRDEVEHGGRTAR